MSAPDPISHPVAVVPPAPAVEERKKAPTLYLIIAFKLIKGVLFFTLAIVVYTLSDNDLPTEFKHVLHRFNHWTWANPEKRFWVDVATQLGSLTEARMVHVAVGTMIYSLFSLVEGIGLMFRIRWIGWLTIGEAMFFIPVEMYELLEDFHWIVFGILVVNITIVWYLLQNRNRLFAHHYSHH